jgi:hypothetical protein
MNYDYISLNKKVTVCKQNVASKVGLTLNATLESRVNRANPIFKRKILRRYWSKK